mmetsp:Transcript_25372/g.65964  ORF Transcript_25372/g.65964 Transcript_25372/m.65964 type:complete len:290 (+) Transcript_25372:1601-2470(+)
MAAARLAARCAWPAAGVGWACLVMAGPAIEVARRDSPAEASGGADVTTRDQRAALRRNRFVVVDGVLSRAEALAANAACERRHESFKKTPQDDPSARTDRVTWVGGDDTSPALRLAIARLRGVASELDTDALGAGAWQGFDDDNASRGHRRSRALGVPLAGQLARYGAAGPRYAPHRDGSVLAFDPSFGAREVTAVLYLCGPAWDEPARNGDDGALVLYCGADAADDDGDSATAVHRVRPVGGRLVLFDSRTVLHEVRPHGRRDDRFALTLWLGGEHYPEFRCLRPYVS